MGIFENLGWNRNLQNPQNLRKVNSHVARKVLENAKLTDSEDSQC